MHLACHVPTKHCTRCLAALLTEACACPTSEISAGMHLLAQGPCCTHPSAQHHSGHIVTIQEVLLGWEDTLGTGATRPGYGSKCRGSGGCGSWGWVVGEALTLVLGHSSPVAPWSSGSSYLPKTLAMLPSNSMSETTSGITCPCSAREMLEDLKLLLMKVTWITSLGRVESW